MLLTLGSGGGDFGVCKSVINAHTIGGLADTRRTLSRCRLHRRLVYRAAGSFLSQSGMRVHAALTLEDREVTTGALHVKTTQTFTHIVIKALFTCYEHFVTEC